ncbi:MAG TPA: ADP-polyphosphate phosphotransferase [Burkholderiales bacterium]|nr:ADP-polyphosphate phosphotransferase [Burkholderiales bacterium]
MSINIADFRIRAGKRARLKKRPTRIAPFYANAYAYQTLLAAQSAEIDSLQQLHYAANRYAILLIFHGMDAAGKDGIIRHVMTGVNPQGCEVTSFKQPSEEELQHDFLWRAVKRLPQRGRIGVFNRSYYEDVLIVRVHPELLHKQGLPEELLDKKTVWNERYRSIVNLERHLSQNGTKVVKFFLHLSEEEQRRRFISRIDEPGKNWKLSAADIEERKFWKRYMSVYETCLSETSTDNAPWYAIPADDKQNARLIVAQVILETMRGLNLQYPSIGAKKTAELQEIRAALESSGKQES